jgi:uncharacterized protein (DUF1684 family)
MSRATLFFAILPVGTILLATTTAPFAKEEADFRANREARLKKPDGWLSVAGLFWLHDGEMTVGSDAKSDIVLPAGTPVRAGVLTMKTGSVTFEPAAGAKDIRIDDKPAVKMVLKPDTDQNTDVLQAGRVALTIIKRGEKTGVRMRDPEAATRLNFTGCKWFPASETWKVKAKWVAYPSPKKIKITNILGMTDEEPSPGYAEFTHAGKMLRLEPVEEDGELSFMFKDLTSDVTTYAPGRFLDTEMPKNGFVTLDFNQAYNPPCAFTAYATCPLPPKQNALPIAVEAGEKKYGNHPAGGSR